MFSELTTLLSSLDVAKSSGGNSKKLAKTILRGSNSRIGSISAYSSNSIFYFPTIVSDQMMPSEQQMIIRMIEKNYASFVIACINLMPVHHVKADDASAITEYFRKFHQNMGMKYVDPSFVTKLNVEFNKALGESANVTEQDFEEFQNFLYECWQKSKATNTDFIKIISETISINDMYNKDPLDPRTRILQEQFNRQMEELEEWGFLGEATEDMFDDDMDLTDEDIADLDEEDPDDEDEDPELSKMIDKMLGENASMNEGNVHQAINSIKFSLESVSENKILSCQSLTKLNGLEGRLKKLKGKYAKYLNRYKAKVKENKDNGTKKSLAIRFNNAMISNPKAFMQQYGEYIKIINRRLKMIEKRRAELRKRKGLTEVAGDINPLTDITKMDFDAVDYCIRSIDECLNAPDSEIFVLTEAKNKEEDDDDDAVIMTVRDKKRLAQYDADADKRKAEEDQIKKWKDDSKELDKRKKAQSQSPLAKSPFSDKSPFTDMDVKKANDAMPMFAKASINFVIDDTGETLQRDLLIGIKAYIHLAPAADLINDIYNCIINKRKFLRFVKFVTGEERSLTDLLFGIRELKTDALSNRTESGKWRSAFRSRRRWAKISVPKLMKEYTPNGTLVITMNEVNYLKDHYGIDIMRPDHVRMLMDADFLLGFVVIDQANEMVHVTYDGHGYGFQQYTYNMLERESQVSQREMMQLYRAFKN
nr:MAG TPA: hypothetical protein [Caudoviricetes sp.]